MPNDYVISCGTCHLIIERVCSDLGTEFQCHIQNALFARRHLGVSGLIPGTTIIMIFIVGSC